MTGPSNNGVLLVTPADVAAAPGLRRVDAAAVADREEAIGRIGDPARPVDVLVLAPGTPEPLSLAQEAQALDPDLAILVVAGGDDGELLTKALRFAPFLGDDVACLDAGDDDLPAHVEAAAARTRRRRELRAAAHDEQGGAPAELASQAERYLGQLLAHAPLGIVAADRAGAVVGWNKRAGEILALREEEVVGTPLCELFPEPERDRADQFVTRSTAAEGHAPSEVFQRTSHEGAQQFLEVTAIPMTGRDEEAGVLVMLRDVTVRVLAQEERRWMEEALRFQKTLLESQSEASAEAMVVVSREGRILSVNRRFCELWEIPDHGVGLRSGDAARGALAEKIVRPADFLARFDALAERVEKTGRETVELADGRSFDTYSGPVSTSEGVHYGRVWFFRDVSDLRRVEAQLHARAREQAAVAWLGQRALAATDLRTLMDEVVAVVADTLRVELAKVLELQPDGRSLLLRAGVGWEEGLVGPGTVDAGRDSQAGYTLLSEEPVVVEDLRTEERFSGPPLLRDHGVVSGMSVVIGGRDPAFGVLGTHTTTPRSFTVDEINFLRSIANVLGAAIERDDADRLRGELLASEQAARDRAERAGRILVELQAVTDAALAHLSLDELLDALLATISELLRTETTAILLLDEEANELVPRAARGFEELLEQDVRIPFGKGLAGRIAAERRALTLADVPDAAVYNPALRTKELASMLGVPLVVEGRVTGIVYVGTHEPRAFTDEDSRLLQLVGDRVGLAIEQSRLFEAERSARAEAQRAHGRLAFLSEATEVLTRSLEYEATLAAVARLAVPTLADWCIVDEVREDGAIARVAVAAASERKQEVLEELRAGYPPHLDSPQPAARALRERATVHFERFSPESLRQTVTDERHWELLSELDPCAAIAVPLVAGDETVGAITFAFAESERVYAPEDVALAEEVARRAALAIERARVYRAEQTARREAERAQDRFAFLAEASEVLTSSLDYEATLERTAALTVPRLADWCIVYVVDDGEIRRLALQHPDSAVRDALAAEIGRFALDPDAEVGVPCVLRTGEPEVYADATPELLAADVADAETFGRLLAPLGITSWMCVPITARGRIVGAISFVAAESGHRYGEADVALAQELARRAGSAIDNARLFREAEERGNAARVLATIADGVFLVDAGGTVRLWNPAAEAITGIPAADAIGRPPETVIPGWDAVGPRVPVAPWPAPAGTRAETLPFDLGGREAWLSIAGVGFEDGIVYAFRDLTEERRVEGLKTEFVATASHELRTPLAAVYGAAMTLRRRDLVLDDERRDLLLNVIAEEADRLSRTVNDILWASRLESGRLDLEVEPLEPLACVESVVEAARTHAPAGIELVVSSEADVPQIVADGDRFRQVLANLVENAVKYSPDGGRVEVRVERAGGAVRVAVADPGLGIPAREQTRIFEKFYRLDPNLTRGVGGTGLGLYICRELVRHMNGRIWVTSEEGRGSTFVVELPLAGAHAAAGAEAPAHAT